jgi:hypothetical protein
VRVIQRDVPVYLEWIGTTEGYVNAEIHRKITDYLLKQEYKDREHVEAGEPTRNAFIQAIIPGFDFYTAPHSQVSGGGKFPPSMPAH